jgi:hypothetical protein
VTKANGAIDKDAAQPSPQKIEKWAAISGRWKFLKTGAKYLGPDEGANFKLGIARASQRFQDGTIKTNIKLKRNIDTTAGVVIGYQSPDAPYAVVSIGGWNRAYDIGEYSPGVGWKSLIAAGALSNLPPDQTLALEVRVVGQTIEMAVDEVDVLRYVLPRPIEGSGFGLYAFGDAEIEFSDTTVAGIQPRMFVMMPFREPFDTLYRDVILPIAKDAGFNVNRVDEVFTPGIILNDIQQQIEQAHAVVADISTHNPNVFYELGYAHALRKPAVLLARRPQTKDEELPFDIRGYRAIFYDDTIGGKKAVESLLRQTLRAIQRDSN